jgi:hypothetical protein
MCRGCWEEEGSPQIDTPEVRAMAERLKTEDPNGRWDIVVDDWNLEDEHVICCRDKVYPEYLPDPTPHDVALGNDLLKLTYEERASALALAEGYWS